MKFTLDELESRYQKATGVVRCECEFATDCVGGQPATDKGIRAFAVHHLGLTDEEEIDKAVKRIQGEEIDVRPELGELEEKKVYGLKVIRRTELGPWLGSWMIKACIKNAASRLNVFREIRGTKGNFAEAGRVAATGISRLAPRNLEQVYLIGPDGNPAQTYYQEIMGRVSSPKGSVSIVETCETVAAGTRFQFEYRFLPEGLKEGDLADILALAMIVGLGSAKALERGKFRITDCEVVLPSAKVSRKVTAKEIQQKAEEPNIVEAAEELAVAS